MKVESVKGNNKSTLLTDTIIYLNGLLICRNHRQNKNQSFLSFKMFLLLYFRILSSPSHLSTGKKDYFNLYQNWSHLFETIS